MLKLIVESLLPVTLKNARQRRPDAQHRSKETACDNGLGRFLSRASDRANLTADIIVRSRIPPLLAEDRRERVGYRPAQRRWGEFRAGEGSRKSLNLDCASEMTLAPKLRSVGSSIAWKRGKKEESGDREREVAREKDRSIDEWLSCMLYFVFENENWRIKWKICPILRIYCTYAVTVGRRCREK